MATVKIDIKKAIDPYWLIENGYTIMLPKNKVHLVRLTSIIWGNLKKDKTVKMVAEFLKCTDGIGDRVVRRYKSFDFAFNESTVGKKIFKDRELFEKHKTETFLVEVKENSSNLIKYHFRVNLKQAEEFNVKQETILDPNEISELRKNITELPAKVELQTPDSIENTAREICKTVATGQFSVHEACDRYNVKYLEFSDWYSSNQYIQQMLAEATVLAQFFNASIQNSRVNKMINELLLMGRTYTETIHYKKIYNDANPGGIWVEDTKTVQYRQLDLKDMVLMKQMLKDTPLPQFAQDEFGELSDSDVFKQYEADRQRMIDKLNEKEK